MSEHYIAIATRFITDGIPEKSINAYKAKYIEMYGACAELVNGGVIDKLNNRFDEEVGKLDNYDCSLYNTWMAARMTEAISKLVKRDHFWDRAYYNEHIVLVCERHGATIRMELVPEEYMQEVTI